MTEELPMMRDGLWKRWRKAAGLAARYGTKASPTLKGGDWATEAERLGERYRAEELRLLEPTAMLEVPE